MAKSPHVFIVNKGMHDYTQAKEFGQDIIELSSGYQSHVNVTKMVRDMADIIEKSDPSDWILISGPTVLNCIVCILFVQRHGKLNLLIHVSRENLYVPRTVSFEEKQDG